MKKIILMLSLILVLALTTTAAYAQDSEIIITIDSVKVEFSEDTGHPFIDENSRTQVPFRKTLEDFGAAVDWDGETNTAIAVKDDIKVEVPIDQNYIFINGEQKNTDTTAKIINSKTYLPIRAVIEAFGASVEWDESLKTVVITSVPVDANAIFTEANNKSYDWKNYNANIAALLSMNVPDESGNVQTLNMKMNMFMTMFTNPMKLKLNADMAVNVAGQELIQPLLNMYMTMDDEGMNQYMGMNDGTGSYIWMKQTIGAEIFGNMLNTDENSVKKNKEMTEKYIKDIKYFGKYKEDDGRTLIRLQYTMSGDIYKDILGENIDKLPEPANEQEKATIDTLKAFAKGGFGDIKSIVYIDESTKEIVKYEMDLGEIIQVMLSGMSDLLGEIPQNELDMLKGIQAHMFMEILDVNEAEDFEIPEEALNAQNMNELEKELEKITNEE